MGCHKLFLNYYYYFLIIIIIFLQWQNFLKKWDKIFESRQFS